MEHRLQHAEMVDEMVETIMTVTQLYMENISPLVSRSHLYSFAGLFRKVLDDEQAIFCLLKEGTDQLTRDTLARGREKILAHTWVSGPLCHELFDLPYRGNIPIDRLLNGPSPRVLIFLEEHELAGWRLLIELTEQPGAIHVNEVAMSIDSSAAKVSAILLGQASEDDLLHAREAMAPIRRKLAENAQLDEEAVKVIARELKAFVKASIGVEDEPITKLACLDDGEKQAVRQLLGKCVFVVRKGAAMDRMYEEPQFTLPGILILERSESFPNLQK